MPNLSNKETHKFWHEYPDPFVYKAIAFMEGVEDWTLDDNDQLEQALEKLGKTLDNIGNIDLQEEERLIKIMSYIKMGRLLRIMQSLNIAYPGAAAKILNHAESNSTDITSLFLRRNIVFERFRLLSRIFAENRLTKISEILEDQKNL